MTFLPVVERELRTAARRKSTYYTRLVASALALAIFAGVWGIAEASRGFGGFAGQLGPVLFGIFSWLSFAFVCVAGVFLTADCFSEEKREGTLGLLFLTDLRGYDVVLGKLFSHSLVAAYGLLAAFPVIGIAFLIGGVTGGEFWRLMLVLFNTLFFCLAAGVLVSVRSRETIKAMSGTAVLCGVFLLLLPGIDWAMAGWQSAGFEPRFSLASPTFTFGQAQRTVLRDFWASLALQHALAWVFLGVASVLAPRCWQETSATSATGAGSRAQQMKFGTPVKRAALRLRWLADNPVRWLAARDLWTGRLLWLALAVVGAVCALLLASASGAQAIIGVANFAHGLLVLVLNLWVALAASRFFVDAVRTGTMELLLATPLQAHQIVQGQWWALRRAFQLPVLVLMLIGAGLSAWRLSLFFTQQNAMQSNFEFTLGYVISAVGSLVTFLSGLVAVAWFGMWMGLVSRKPNQAVIKTIAFVQVLPFIGLMFLQMFLMFGLIAAFSGRFGYGVSQLVMVVLAVALDIVLIIVSRRKLLHSFRELAARAIGASDTPAATAKPLPPPAGSTGAAPQAPPPL